MNPIERFGTFIADGFPYVIAVGFVLGFLWLLYLTVRIGRLRMQSLDDGALFRHPQRPLQIRYPPSWDVRVVGDLVEFDSREAIGVLRLTCRDAHGCTETSPELVQAAIANMNAVLDDPAVRHLNVNPYPGAHASGPADVASPAGPATAPPSTARAARCYASAWAFRGPRTVAVFAYQCAVLQGAVDGYYHDLMMRTLLLDDDVAPETAPRHTREREDAPVLAGV